MKIFHLLLVAAFIIIYSAFVLFVHIDIDLDIASELMVASAFFFALFSGFFIARQNDRYNEIVATIAERDGLFSYIYRVFGLVPRMQGEIREIVKAHYQRILKHNDWAYNEFHPSDTLTKITKTFGSLTKEEGESIDSKSPYDGIWDTILQLQQIRKKIIAEYHERMLFFQWIVIYIFAGLVLLSFHLIPSESMLVDVLKIVFGTAVFLVIILIKQLNDLSIFGKDFSRKIAQDVIDILEEKDSQKIAE